MASLTESRFEQIAGETLDNLFDALEASLDEALGSRADVELEAGILTVDVEGTGRWVINKHAVNQQLWLSSPLSGAAHFDWNGSDDWIGSRGEGALRDRLTAELSKVAGCAINLP